MSKTLFLARAPQHAMLVSANCGLTYSALEPIDLMGLYRLCKESKKKTSVPVRASSAGQMNTGRVAGGFAVDLY